jgi:hypothetical protein
MFHKNISRLAAGEDNSQDGGNFILQKTISLFDIVELTVQNNNYYYLPV